MKGSPRPLPDDVLKPYKPEKYEKGEPMERILKQLKLAREAVVAEGSPANLKKHLVELGRWMPRWERELSERSKVKRVRRS
jgi:hypothetical protein